MDIFFYKGNENVLSALTTEEEGLTKIKDSFTKVLDVKNLSFLLGCGCSSLIVKIPGETPLDPHVDAEVGIPIMSLLSSKFYASFDPGDIIWLKDTLSIDI